MKILKELTLKAKILIIVCLIGIGAGVYYLCQEEPIQLKLLSDKTETIEYGQTKEFTFKNLVDTKDLSKEEIKELEKETKIKSNIVNEKDKKYPAVGQYKITLQYNDQKQTKKVTVKDTTKPTIQEPKEINIPYDSKDFNFNAIIKATDLSGAKITYDFTGLDTKKAGDYKIKVIAKDQYNNEETKEITVHVQKKVETPQQTASSSSSSSSSITPVKGVTYKGNGKVVCIDAGHQGRQNSEREPIGPGASQTKMKVTSGAAGEAQINLSVAIKLQRILTSRGYTVVMCRTSQDVNISNAQRAQIANEAHAAAFVRIHCDDSDSSSPSGVLTMAPSSSNPYCSSIAGSSQALSKSILNNVCAKTGAKSRGVSITDSMTGLNWSKVPVTIVEMGFLSNPTEKQKLNSDSYQDLLAQGIADGIGEYLK